MEDNDEDERMEGSMISSKAGPSQLDCISDSLADEPSHPYRWCHNIEGLKFPSPQTAVQRTGTTPPGNRRTGASTKADVQCILRRVRAYVVLNSILRELKRSPSHTLLVHTVYTEREDSECDEKGYSGSLL